MALPISGKNLKNWMNVRDELSENLPRGLAQQKTFKISLILKQNHVQMFLEKWFS